MFSPQISKAPGELNILVLYISMSTCIASKMKSNVISILHTLFFSNFTMPDNCTLSINGTFQSILTNVDMDNLGDTFVGNLKMDFRQDCSNRLNYVDFAYIILQ